MSRHINKTSFKSGKGHRYWKGGDYCYWHREARKVVNCPKGMVVHHIDGNWKNNNLINLQILSQSEHMKIHHKEKPRNGTKILSSLKYNIKDKVSELTIKGYPSRKIAKILCVGKTTVLRSRRINKIGGE